MKRELWGHLLVTAVWLSLITLLRWQWKLELVWLWSGGLAGTFLIDLAEFLNQTGGERLKPALHNVLFQAILLVVCFWVLSSTAGLFGKGLVMAMALHLLKDEFQLLAGGKIEYLRQSHFWVVQKEVSPKAIKVFVLGMAGIFVFLNLFLIK